MKHFNKAVWNSKSFFKESVNPVRNSYNSFTVFMQMLNVDLDCLVRVIGKALTLPKHENIKLNSLTQTRGEGIFLFWVELGAFIFIF